MRLTLTLLLLAPLALAQSPAQTPAPSTCATPSLATFDVATVKPSDRPSGSSSLGGRPDTLNASGSVFRLIQYAYKLHDFQVSGGPGWLATSTWEVTAKVDQPPAGYDTLPNDSRDAIQRQRLQAVLAQRFALKCHFETKQLPVYNLVLAKGGPKPALSPTPADAKYKGSLSSNGRNRVIRVEGTGVSLPFITAILTQGVGRQIIDKTGLTGLYTFTLTYAPDPGPGSSAASTDQPSGPTIFTALEEQLGLKLEPAKGLVPVLVIDSAQKPSEN